MPPHEQSRHAVRKISGTVTDVFAHRFVFQTEEGRRLGDLTPTGAVDVTLKIGDEIEIEGEQKASEVKVAKITHGGRTVSIGHNPPKQPGPHDQGYPNPAPVIAAAESAGYRIVGEPRRKPKHFEILGQRGDELHELHVQFDGHIRKSKPVSKDDRRFKSDSPAANRA